MNGKTFLYHAHGTAVGGAIRRPFNEAIENQAAVALPVVGGYGMSRAPEFNHREIVKFSAAYTQVSGSYNPADDTYTTLVSSVVEGLNVLDVVKAARVTARISTQRHLDEPETHVIATGSNIEGLTVAGQSVELEIDTDVWHQHDTYSAFKNKYKQDNQFREMMRGRFVWGEQNNNAPEFLKQRYNWHKQAETLLETNGLVPCSLTKSLKCNCTEVKKCGNVLKIPQFGTVHIADWMVAPHRRRLTMLRFELGSPTEGTLEIGGIEGNGTTVP